MMLEHVGYPHIEWFDWYGQTIEDWGQLEEYRDGTKATLTATRAAG